MTQTHIPVLAGELIELLDPHPGEIAVDCTFGGGGHARLIADRIGPAGTLIAIDRDPVAEERFAELASEVPCHTRFIRADFATGLASCSKRAPAADLAYLDLGMSSMQVDTWARGFSYAYDAPLDMRMDPDQELTARGDRQHLGRAAARRLLREYGEERYASQIARAIVPRPPPRGAGQHPAARRRDQVRGPDARPVRRRPSRHAARSRRCGSRSTTSSGSSTRRCRWPGSCCGPVAGSARSRSTRSRTGA